MIHIMIVDDDIEAAKALKRNIDGQRDITVVGLFDNGLDAVKACLTIKPDLVLLDIKMPRMDGIETCRRIKEIDPEIKILILTFYQVKDNEIAAIKSGCDGYLYKGHNSDEIIMIIKNTLKGLATYENGVKNTLYDEITHMPDNALINKDIGKLTQRQIEIVRLITAGKKDAEIAGELFISEGYLRNQLVTIREILNLRNSKELAVWGARAGL